MLTLVVQLGATCACAARLDGVSSTPLTAYHTGTLRRSYVYHWRMESGTTCPVELRYFQAQSDGYWTLELPQLPMRFWDRTWTNEIGIYPEEELLAVLEQTLADFSKREPDAKLDRIQVWVHVVAEMWRDFISKFALSIRSIRGESEGAHWDALRPRADAALKDNPTVRKMKTVMRRAGYVTDRSGFGGPEKCPDVIRGVEWKQLAKMPDAGLRAPIFVTFVVLEKRKPDSQTPKARKPR